MCLSQLRKFKVPTYGYKIFIVEKITMNNTDKLFSVFQGEPKEYPINKILDEKHFRYYNCEEKLIMNTYPYGFHIFKTLKSAKIRLNNFIKRDKNCYTNCQIYKVEIIEPLVTGFEVLNNSYCHVIVSKKMRLIEKIC